MHWRIGGCSSRAALAKAETVQVLLEQATEVVAYGGYKSLEAPVDACIKLAYGSGCADT